MSDISKPLYMLTISEYKELHQDMLSEQLSAMTELISNSVKKSPKSDIIFIDDAMELTGYAKPTIYSKVCLYEIPVLSRNKPLTFSKKTLIEWIEQGKPNVLELQADQHIEKANKRKRQ